jgi:hypothetical protein
VPDTCHSCEYLVFQVSIRFPNSRFCFCRVSVAVKWLVYDLFFAVVLETKISGSRTNSFFSWWLSQSYHMRSLRLLSFGNCSSAWTQQINVSSLCLRLALTQQQQQPSVCATGGSRKGLGVLLLELKAFGQLDASVRAFVHPVFRDYFSNESSDFLSAGCLCTDGCTLSLGLGGRRRYHTSVIVAGKYRRMLGRTSDCRT